MISKLFIFQWLYAQKYYGQFGQDFRHLQQNRRLNPLTQVPPSKDSAKVKENNF